MYNNVFYFQHDIDISWDVTKITDCISTVLSEFPKVYSLLIRKLQDNDSMIVLRYAISETDKFNTIDKSMIFAKVFEILNGLMDKPILGYIQPPLDLIVEIYDPLVHKLSTKQHRKWKMIDYDDLCQICRLTLILLYNDGYYIHKSLLEKSFNNAVLQEVKKLSHEVNFVSFETQVEGEDMEKLTLEDTLHDVDEERKKQDEESEEISKMIFTEVKDILVDVMGERQFEQLFRDYANGHTSTWSRRKMQTVKNLFEQQGLTRRKFNNKYGG